MLDKYKKLSFNDNYILHPYFTVLGCSLVKKNLNATESISSSTQSIHSLSSMPGDMSQVDGRVSRWALGFDKLMEDPAGLGCFKVLCKYSNIIIRSRPPCATTSHMGPPLIDDHPY